MEKNTRFPAITTPQMAKLLGVRYHAVYTSYQRTGQYKGIRPICTAPRHILWPRADVLALRQTKQARQDLRPWLAVVEGGGFPVEAQDMAVGGFLLAESRGDSTQAACAVAHDEAQLLQQLASAWASRVFAHIKQMTASDRLAVCRSAQAMAESAKAVCFGVESDEAAA